MTSTLQNPTVNSQFSSWNSQLILLPLSWNTFFHSVSRTSLSCGSPLVSSSLMLSALCLLSPCAPELGSWDASLLSLFSFLGWWSHPTLHFKCRLYSDNSQFYSFNLDFSLKSRLLPTTAFLTTPLGYRNDNLGLTNPKPNSWFPHLKPPSIVFVHFGKGNSTLPDSQTWDHLWLLFLPHSTHEAILWALPSK